MSVREQCWVSFTVGFVLALVVVTAVMVRRHEQPASPAWPVNEPAGSTI